MATTTLVPLSEYLRTMYRPDRDYLEGHLLERNMGEQPHARLQGYLLGLFFSKGKEWGVRALPEQRVQVRTERYRIPDVSVIRRTDPNDLILTVAPLLCIEVLSSEDTMADMRRRAEDYTAMGVSHIWAVDPWKRRAFTWTGGDFEAAPANAALSVAGTAIVVGLPELFAELDD